MPRGLKTKYFEKGLIFRFSFFSRAPRSSSSIKQKYPTSSKSNEAIELENTGHNWIHHLKPCKFRFRAISTAIGGPESAKDRFSSKMEFASAKCCLGSYTAKQKINRAPGPIESDFRANTDPICGFPTDRSNRESLVFEMAVEPPVAGVVSLGTRGSQSFQDTVLKRPSWIQCCKSSWYATTLILKFSVTSLVTLRNRV